VELGEVEVILKGEVAYVQYKLHCSTHLFGMPINLEFHIDFEFYSPLYRIGIK
jgi:hypothetical protein